MKSDLETRLAEAKLIPIKEGIDRLGIAGLARAGGEFVGPCPVCGGKDRFSINPARGVFNCRRCARGGDIVALVEHVLGCDFRAALDFLVGQGDPVLDARARKERADKARALEEKRAREAARFRQAAIDQARAIWARAGTGAGTPAQDYLAARKITLETWPPTLRYLPDHPMIKRIPGARRASEVWRGPAMIAAIQDAAGRIRAVHQTWIDPARPGQKAVITHPDLEGPLPAKLVRGSKKGGAIRFGALAPGGTLVMGEGIETTLSAYTVRHRFDAGVVFWAAVDLGNMAGRQVRGSPGVPDLSDLDAFVPPEGTGCLIYLQDGDSDPAATRAKLEAGLARARRMVPGLETRLAVADPGKDFNDML